MSVADSQALPAGGHAHDAHDAHGAAHGDGHGGHHSLVAHQFDDMAQQKEAVTLGMWAFLATEVMFFGGVLLGYAVYRNSYPDAFAEASRHESWQIGALNTGVLLCSSLTVALAVYFAHQGNNRRIIQMFGLTILLGLTFIGVKAFEYNHLIHEHLVPGRHFDAPRYDHGGNELPPHFGDLQRRPAEIFFSFYFGMTGLHALHMIIGVGIMLYIMWMAWKGRFNEEYYNPVEVTGLYWHFVDIVWIFLYPLLYLIDRTGG